MVERIYGFHGYHVARALPYNKHPPFRLGGIVNIGSGYNPFFGFYEGSRTYRVNTAEGDLDIRAIKFLKAVRDGQINCSNIAQIGAEVAEHYVMLTRELIMENTRLEVDASLPSRQRCLWVADSLEQSKDWKRRLGETGTIIQLSLNGYIHRADAALLLGDSEPLSITYTRARSYWRGEISEKPELETLFEGEATVVGILE